MSWSKIENKEPKPIGWWYHKFLCEFWWWFRNNVNYSKGQVDLLVASSLFEGIGILRRILNVSPANPYYFSFS